MRLMTARLILCCMALTMACARSPSIRLPAAPPADERELWIEPADIEQRDLFRGPDVQPAAPASGATFTFVAADTTGFSPGYDVRDAAGTQWNVKLGPEAQTEVAASRVLWAVGYHQVPAHYVPSWTLTGAQAGPQSAARFRPDVPGRRVVADWSWYDNPFLHTRAFKGLLVANLIVNNWDWKTSNNKVYEIAAPTSGGPARHYIVRDVGASFGKTTYSAFFRTLRLRGFGQGTRNDLPGYESQNLIRGVDNGRIRFDYKGIHEPLLETVTVDDVKWICGLMSRVSEQQWLDAFRAAGYPEDVRRRYVRKLMAKIAEGQKL